LNAAVAPEISAGPLRAALSGNELRIGWDEPDWLGPGRLVVPDAAEGAITADVRALDGEPVVVVRIEAGRAVRDLGTGEFAQPSVSWHFDPARRGDGGAPDGVRAFGFQYTEFALPVFSDAAMSRWRLLPIRPPVVLPFGMVAPDGRTVLLAPLNAFHEQVLVVPSGKDDADAGLRVGWHGDVDAVDEGFATELAVIAGHGVRDCFATWARLLREASGVAPPPRDRDVLGTRLSYWTDNGSAYWYRTEGDLDAASTVVAAVDDLEARGIPVGAVQLDSWWYPHEVVRPFNTDEWVVPPSGMVTWEPRTDVFPDGIGPLRERLARRPLVTHTRHLSSQSPYCDEFPMWIDGDRAHPQDARLYERLLDQCVAWGVEVFEHDWLIECFLGVRGLRAPGRAAAWQEGIDAALEARALTAQWCMASPADFAQASRLRNVTSIRTSGDHGYLVGPEVLWAWFLHTNVIARALGLWPYKDVFHSGIDSPPREVEALLAALSAGPVGIGDRVGAADPAIIRRTCRADGVLVRPDVPVAAIDGATFDAPVWTGALLTGTAHTDHPAGRWSYVVTANVGMEPKPNSTRVALADLGEDRPDTDAIVVFDWRAGTVDVLSRDGSWEVALDPADWDYRVLAPVLANGIAVVGDPGVYASAGDSRIADVTVDGDDVTITVLGPSERVRVAGWSEHALTARVWFPGSGSTEGPVARDDTSGQWEVSVEIPSSGWAQLRLRGKT
jgi:hypothetical protein